MKLKAFIVLSLLTATTAFAQFFPARVEVVVLPGQIAAQVTNPFFQPIICNGQVFGQVTSGAVFTTYFAEQFMPVGSYRFAYVTTTPFLPFVNGWANIHCRHLGW
jgi:hypothetical protein